MAAPAGRRAFALLFREFFSQLFITESPLSDHPLLQAMIGVLAFVVTPGFFLSLQLAGAFEMAARQDTGMLDALTRMLATVFLTYSTVVVGVIAAFEWDALAFDRRDAMVLGPLPVSGRTVVAAKASALAALLLVVNLGVNGLTALTFSFVASSVGGYGAIGRLFMAHMVATTAAAVFIFCTLVTIRSVVGYLGRGRIVVGSLLQFSLISALLCFLIVAPTAVKLEFPRRGMVDRTIHVRVQPVLAWSPMGDFAALYDELRGHAPAPEAPQARMALALVFGSAFAALAAIVTGYRRQLQLALTPSNTPGAVAAGRLHRRLARALSGRARQARGIADFMVTTLVRSRAQQAPIAMNAAIAVVMIAIYFSGRPVEAAAVTHLSAALSPVPLLVVFWVAVGLRASFFVPAELPAAWAFSMHSANASGVRHSAIRGAMAAVLVPAAGALAALLSARLGWVVIAGRAGFAALAALLLVELMALTVTFTPYTRPYQPGHAKLKTRWPLYLAGAYAFSYGLTAIERASSAHPTWFVAVLLALAGVAVALDAVGRTRRLQAIDVVEEPGPWATYG